MLLKMPSDGSISNFKIPITTDYWADGALVHQRELIENWQLTGYVFNKPIFKVSICITMIKIVS